MTALLIEGVAAGYPEATERLLFLLQPNVTAMSRRYRVRGWERGDYEQHVALRIRGWAQRYHGRTSPVSFFYRCFANELKMELRKQMARPMELSAAQTEHSLSLFRATYGSLNQHYASLEPAADTPLLERAELDEAIRRIEAAHAAGVINDRHRTLLLLQAEGLGLSAISEAAGEASKGACRKAREYALARVAAHNATLSAA